jgi:hypothetical protein
VKAFLNWKALLVCVYVRMTGFGFKNIEQSSVSKWMCCKRGRQFMYIHIYTKESQGD